MPPLSPQISCGHFHTTALIEVTRPDMRVEITLFAWGCPDDKRLGDCNPAMSHVPQEVHSITRMAKKQHWKFKDVEAGGAHTLLLEKYNGLVLAFGQGKYVRHDATGAQKTKRLACSLLGRACECKNG